MREARLIVPQHSNTGADLSALSRRVASYLAATFGGFTQFAANGGWVGASGEVINEPVNIFDVAMEIDERSESLMRGLAEIVARVGEQEAVYLRHASGKVEFVKAELEVRAA